jgi:hypothetical protein
MPKNGESFFPPFWKIKNVRPNFAGLRIEHHQKLTDLQPHQTYG